MNWKNELHNGLFSDFGLPYGIFSTAADSRKRIGVAVGNFVLDLGILHSEKLLELEGFDFYQDYLNPFIALGRAHTSSVRQQLLLLIDSWSGVPMSAPQVALHPLRECLVHMPIAVGDYTDFYSSMDHATNVGKMFRDPANALLPNWRHMPVAYHGRASSIIPSGQNIHRPSGQIMPAGADSPMFGPSQRMDFEVEMAFVIGQDSQLGCSISTSEAEDHIFGLVLFNDWSARDIQKWEYVPLGPFLGKNFASSISPWVVPLEALEEFRVEGPEQIPPVLPYLQYSGKKHYSIEISMDIETARGNKATLTQTNFHNLYWNMCQQLAHHTVNGCNVRVGDLLASGTISGSEKKSFGSMLELSWSGTQSIPVGDERRTFLEDGDILTMAAKAQNAHKKIYFGEVRTTLLAPLN